MSPLRLVAQDIGFSVREQGFDSPRGYISILSVGLSPPAVATTRRRFVFLDGPRTCASPVSLGILQEDSPAFDGVRATSPSNCCP